MSGLTMFIVITACYLVLAIILGVFLELNSEFKFITMGGLDFVKPSNGGNNIVLLIIWPIALAIIVIILPIWLSYTKLRRYFLNKSK